MTWWSAIPILGKVVEQTLSVIDKSIEDKDKANELKIALTESLDKADKAEYMAIVNAQRDVLVAEISGESWLQRNWRPLLMMICIVIVANNYIIYPYLSFFTEKTVVLELPPDLWALMKIGVGGYIASRGGEKITKIWKGGI